MKYYHEILAEGQDFETCKRKVLHFFHNYQLVRYSRIDVLEGESIQASNPVFWERLEKAILNNRRVLQNLIAELEDEGIKALKELNKLPQGYKSKMLHTITHLLDGFFGIDTYFYNLRLLQKS